MYGIEQKIIEWIKKLKKQPVTSETQNETVKKAQTADNKVKVESNANTKSESVEAPKKTSTNATTSTSDLKSQMKETIKNYRNKLDGVIDDEYLQKMEYTPKTEQEIQNLATNYAQGEYDVKKVKLDGDIQNKREESKQKEEVIKASEEPKKEQIEQKYDNLEKGTLNKAIKNGISRSSILLESLKNLSENKIQEELNVDKEIASSLKANANKLEALEKEYSSAVSALEIQKAIDVKEKIDELYKEQQKKLDEVLKYNNTIDEKIYKLKSQGIELPSESEKAEYRKQMLDSALQYYYTLDPSVAREEFSKDVDIQYLLGSLSQIVERYLKNR